MSSIRGGRSNGSIGSGRPAGSGPSGSSAYSDINGKKAALLNVLNKRTSGMCEILPNLYLGGMFDAKDVDQLDRHRIRAIVAIYELEVHCPYYAEKGVRRLQFRVSDTPNTDLSVYFTEAVKFIHEARVRQESVLVHCMAGVSRSATIVTAYLIAACDLSFYNAMAFVTARRPCANPNFGFRLLLAKYGDKGGGRADRVRLRQMLGDVKFMEQWERDRAVVRSKIATQNMSTEELALWYRELRLNDGHHAAARGADPRGPPRGGVGGRSVSPRHRL